MTWFVLQSLFFVLGAFVVGLVAGWLAWGRQERPERVVVLRADGTTAPPATGQFVAIGADDVPQATPAPTPEPVKPEPAKAEPVEPEPAKAEEAPVPFPPAPAPVVAEPEPEEPALAKPEPAAPTPAAEPAPSKAAPVNAAAAPEAAKTAALEPAKAAATPVKTAAAPEPAEAAATGASSEDDLRRIEGVGPKVAAALKANGIGTYTALAATDEAELRRVLRAAGLRFSPSLSSWPDQARLLAAGDDAGFAELSATVAANRRTAGTA